jgi:hypothetical protein
MNKGRKQELTSLKFKNRIQRIGIGATEANLWAYKSHGKPCSCFICRNPKYRNTKRPLDTKVERDFIEDYYIGEMKDEEIVISRLIE